MTLKKSSSKSAVFTVFYTQLYQMRMLLILFGLILAAFPTILTLGEFTNRNWSQYEIGWVVQSVQQFMLVGGLAPLIGLAIGMAVAEFGYLHKRQSLDYFHALPVSRADHFLGRVLAAFVSVVTGTVLVGVGQAFAISVTLGISHPEVFGYIWLFIGLMILAAMCAYFFTALIMVLTATLWEMIFSLLAVSAAYPITAALTMEIVYCSVPITDLSLDFYDVTVFSPLLTGIGMLVEFSLTDPFPTLGWYLLLAVVQILICGAMGFYFFVHRHSELAESGGATRFKVVVRFVTAVMASFVGSVILLWITNTYVGYLIGSVIGFVAAWLIMELLYTRTLRKALHCLIPNLAGYGVFVVINILVAFGLIGVPQLPHLENVNAVSVSYDRWETSADGLISQNDSLSSHVETVYTDVEPRDVRMGTFDGALVEKGYALAKEMLENQWELYFPYHPICCGTPTGSVYYRDEYIENGVSRISVGVELYLEDDVLGLNYSNFGYNGSVEEMYTMAKEIAVDPDYVKSNPTLAFFENIDHVDFYNYETDHSAQMFTMETIEDREAFIERLKEAYLQDLYVSTVQDGEEAVTETFGEYTVYFNSDPITLQGGIIDGRYPAEGLECWLSWFFTPEYMSEEFTLQEYVYEPKNHCMYFYSADFPNTCAVLDEIRE